LAASISILVKQLVNEIHMSKSQIWFRSMLLFFFVNVVGTKWCHDKGKMEIGNISCFNVIGVSEIFFSGL